MDVDGDVDGDVGGLMTGQISKITEALGNVEKLFHDLDLDNLDYDEFVENLSPLDRAKFDITLLYANNSLFWMYLKAQGEDPASHPIKDEMDRIKKQMYRMKEITDRNEQVQRTRRIDGEMVKRIVKHELWENSLKDKKAGGGRTGTVADEEEDWDEPAAQPPSSMDIETTETETDNDTTENQVKKVNDES